MKYVKQLSVVLVLIITTALVGCNANTPSDVVSEYFDKVKKGDTSAKELFAVVEESGQEVLDEDGVSKEVTDKLIKKMKKLTYKINSEEINGDTAKVNVTVNSMNFGEVFGKVFSESMNYFMGQAFSGVEMSDEDSENYMNDLLSKHLDEVSYSDKTDDITLSKIDGKWKIDESESLVKLVMGFDSSMLDGME